MVAACELMLTDKSKDFTIEFFEYNGNTNKDCGLASPFFNSL